MTDTSELQKLLDSVRLPLSAVDTADYSEVFDEDGQKVALTVQPKILVAAVNAMPEYVEQQATIARLTAERDALVEALRPFQRYAESVLKETRLGGRANDDRHIYRLDGVKITYGDLRRARALVRDGVGDA